MGTDDLLLGNLQIQKDTFGERKETSLLVHQNLSHSSHHSDLGLSENRLSQILLASHHVRY